MEWYQIASIVVLILAFFLGTWVRKLRSLLREIAEFATTSADALEEESEGGTNITENEWIKIAKEAIDIVQVIKFMANRK